MRIIRTEYQKKDFYFPLLLVALLFVFYPDLFFAKAASLKGDHIEQHYPWAFLLAQSVKHFQIPWWTNLIHCGFPIVAEGQIGAFYPINLLLYFLLPFKWAYSYMNVVHFFISGYATYLYARTMKLDFLPASMASFIFLFGAAFGGAYYNITSLKTIAWFPALLFAFEQFYQNGKWRYLFALSFLSSFLLLAGYLQIAVMGMSVFSLYVLLRISLSHHEDRATLPKLKILTSLLMAMVFTAFLVFPQLFLTFQLALHSNRVHLGESYAYVGSMSPLAIWTLFLSEAQGFLRGNSLYSGVLSLFFILCAFYSKSCRKTILFKIWFWIGLISIFLALGRWSPLYIGIIRLTHFYSFRVPAKFLVFICFAAAMIAAIGLQVLMERVQSPKKVYRLTREAITFGALSFVASSFHVLIYLFLTKEKVLTFQTGQWFIRKFVFGQEGHPYSLEIYYKKLEDSLQAIIAILSFHNPWIVWNYFLLVLSLAGVFFLWKTKRFHQMCLVCSIFLLVIDLYVFSWRDIRRDFDTYQNVEYRLSVIDELVQKNQDGFMGRLYSINGGDQNFPLLPNMNMLFGIEEIGAYSPLVFQRYHETIGLFGSVDDSTLSFPLQPDFFQKHFNLLNLLDVSHIISSHPLSYPWLKLVRHREDSEIFVYENQSDYQRAFFVSKVKVLPNWRELKEQFLKENFDPREILLLEASEFKMIRSQYSEKKSKSTKASLTRLEHTPNSELWMADVNSAGFFVLSNTMYPGWTAALNRKETPLIAAYGLFQAIWINGAGTYEIRLRYNPFSFGKTKVS